MATTKLNFAIAVIVALTGLDCGGRSYGQAPTSPIHDQLGEALPAAALRRLGSSRLTLQGTVFCLAFLPDGKTLASGGGYGDATIRLWEPSTGKEILRIRDGGVVRDLVWSTDGKFLISASDGDGIRFWEAATGKRVRHFPEDGASTLRLALISDGRTLAVGETHRTGASRQDVFCLRDIATGKLLHRFETPRAYNVSFAPDGQTVAMAGEPRRIRLWEVGAGKELPSLEGHKGTTYAVGFSPDGKWLASSSTNDVDASTCLWEWPSRRLAHRLDTPSGVYGIRFSPDGRTLATGSPTGTIQLWDVATGREIGQMNGHHGPIDEIAFSPDGNTMASAGIWERTIRIWDVARAKELDLDRHRGEVSAVAFAPDNRILATASHDQSVVLWKTATGEKVGELLGHRGNVNAVAYSPDGQLVATGGVDKSIRLWKAATGESVKQFHATHYAITSLAFAPDNRILATGEALAGSLPSGARMPDGAVRLWDIATGKTVFELQAKTGRVNTVAYSADGRILASAGHDDATIHLWNPISGKPLFVIESEPEPDTPPSMAEGISCIAFSPDGRTLASVSRYRFPSNLRAINEKPHFVRMVRLWEVVSGKERFQIKSAFRPSDETLSAIPHEFESVTFSADGQVLVLGRVDGAVSVWDLPSARETRVIPAHKDKIAALALSSDGKTSATGSWDTTALLWDATALLEPKRAQPVGLSERERETLWGDLASPDGRRADRAIWAMVREHPSCLPLLKERLKPFPKVDPVRISRLIEQLDDAQFTVRARALDELDKLGEIPLPALRKTMSDPISLEARRRIEKLLQKFGDPVPALDILRTLRAVEVLEKVGVPEARVLLQLLGEGALEARETQAAQASLNRLLGRQTID